MPKSDDNNMATHYVHILELNGYIQKQICKNIFKSKQKMLQKTKWST